MTHGPLVNTRAGDVGAHLDVSYGEKDQAKALGARWDQAARRWCDPAPPTAALWRMTVTTRSVWTLS